MGGPSCPGVQHRPAEEMYDLVNDPLELNNLADDPPYAGVKRTVGSIGCLDVTTGRQGTGNRNESH